MKFLIIIYAEYNDEKASKKAMYEENDEDSAIATFHTTFGSYMKDPAVEHMLVQVIGTNGNIIELKTFDRKH